VVPITEGLEMTALTEFGNYQVIDDRKGSSGWDMWGKRLNDVAGLLGSDILLQVSTTHSKRLSL
jgi:hypothetical protein